MVDERNANPINCDCLACGSKCTHDETKDRIRYRTCSETIGGRFSNNNPIIHYPLEKLIRKYYPVQHVDDHRLDKNFYQEWTFGKSMNHKNLVKYHEWSRVLLDNKKEDFYYELSMPYYSRGSLNSIIQNQNIIYTMRNVLYWIEQLFAAVHYLENTIKIVHRDIKPENILVDQGFVLKLGDFERAVSLSAPRSEKAPILSYMAPEVYFEKNDSDIKLTSKSDLFSMSLIAWELIERCPIYFADYGHQSRNLKSLCDYRAGLWTPVFAKCSHKIKFLLYKCMDYEYQKRPTVTKAYEAVRGMNREGLIPIEFPRIDESQEILLKPIGFDGTNTSTFTEYPDCYEETTAGRGSTNIFDKIQQICEEAIRTFESMGPELHQHDYINDFFNNFLDTMLFCSRFLPQFLEGSYDRVFIEGILTGYSYLPLKYVFFLDEYPEYKPISTKTLNDDFYCLQTVETVEYQKFNEREKEYLSAMSGGLLSRSLKHYIRTLRMILVKQFQKMHAVYKTFFAGDSIDLEWEFLSITRFGLYHMREDNSTNFFKLAVYRCAENWKNSWILLSRKEKLFISMDTTKKKRLEGSFSPSYDSFECITPGLTLERYDAVGLNEKTLYKLTSYLKTPESQFELKMLERTYSPGDIRFPYIGYIFQLNTCPSESPFIIYSQLSYPALKGYDSFHQKIQNFLNQSFERKSFLEDIASDSGTPMYFYFFQLATKNSILVLELPTEKDEMVFCFNLETGRTFKQALQIVEIDYHNLTRVVIEDLNIQNTSIQKALEKRTKATLEPVSFTNDDDVEIPSWTNS